MKRFVTLFIAALLFITTMAVGCHKQNEDLTISPEAEVNRLIREMAYAHGDPTQSPEAGASNKDAVERKLTNSESLTADELETLKTNAMDIAAMVANLTGRSENELLKEWGLK